MVSFKKIVLSVSALLSVSAVALGDVTLSAIVTNAQNNVGTDIPAGRLTLLVVDAGDDSFGDLTPGSLFDDTFMSGASDPDLFLAALGSSFSFSGDGVVPFSFQSVTLSQTNLLGDSLGAGDDFWVLWFPDLPSGTTSLAAGDRYGLARFSDWSLPGDGGTIAGTTVNGGLANLQVIPEPSTYALIVLGLAVVGGLRFRRKQ